MPDTPISRIDDDEFTPLAERLRGKRYVCAECMHCKVFREVNRIGRYILKCRCAKGHWWRGKIEITCDLHLVGERYRRFCPDYESTSEDEQERIGYIEDLEEFLPLERHIHEPDGAFVSKLETMTWRRNDT